MEVVSFLTTSLWLVTCHPYEPMEIMNPFPKGHLVNFTHLLCDRTSHYHTRKYFPWQNILITHPLSIFLWQDVYVTWIQQGNMLCSYRYSFAFNVYIIIMVCVHSLLSAHFFQQSCLFSQVHASILESISVWVKLEE